jgi:long-chain acyl-CoA synthetase
VTEPVGVEILTADAAEGAQRRAAGALAAAGLSAGDRVAFALGSSAALLCAVLGALRVGVVPVLLNATLTDAERDVLIDDCRPGLVVTDPGHLSRLDQGPPVDLAARPRARPMHYTSGTTGRSKGVWSGLWESDTAARAFDDEADLWSFGPDDVHLVCSPMYHSVSVRFAGGTLLRGGTCVILSRFDAQAAREVLRGGYGIRPTTTFMAPAALSRLVGTDPASASDPGRPTDPRTFDALRLLVHAGSPCPPGLKRQVLNQVGPDVLWEFYGSTEGQFTVCSPDEWTARPGTVGRARRGRTLSVDDDGTIWCRPPDFARFTYWGDEDKTASAWRDGAFTVGDLGRIDADGYLYLDGRRDDLIISGGVNVYPAEVEGALSDVAGLAELAVFGLPDPQWGERVCAALVAAEPTGPGATSDLVDRVRTRAMARLAPYKRPKRYVVLDRLPRTATDKVQRHLLPGLVDRAAPPPSD